MMNENDREKLRFKERSVNLAFDFEENSGPHARLRVVGVGGAGGNALNRMIAEGLNGVEFIAINTDEQALNICNAHVKLRIGNKTTQGLGAGADPDRGRRAIEEDCDLVTSALTGSDLVFITAGMGGGTGTGASPIVAEIAKGLGALTVGIVTKPFLFEGPKRWQRAEAGIEALKEVVHTLIVVPNQRLLTIVPKSTPLDAGFRYADEILFNATRGISDLITNPGLVNLDFADVRSVMSEMGDALMGCGKASGENRAQIAAQQAIHSPLLEDVSIEGALGLLVNITGGPDMSMHELNEAATMISEEAGTNANIIFGAVIDKNIKDEIRITVVATGLSHNKLLPRIPNFGYNRVPFPATGPFDPKDVPAVNRLDHIQEQIKHTSVDNFEFGKPREPREPRPLNGSKDRDRAKNRFLDQLDRNQNQHADEIDFTKRPLPRPEADIPDDDQEIPACRRPRWSMHS
jgi:cell division protein FtsZ